MVIPGRSPDRRTDARMKRIGCRAVIIFNIEKSVRGTFARSGSFGEGGLVLARDDHD